MSKYQRPWWLLVNKSAGLITSIHEDSGPNERVFKIKGEPLVQGLAWLTWGPVAALLVIVALTGLAINLNIREQPGSIRFLFIAAFLLLPALAWGLVTVVANKLSAKHLQAEREAETQECDICLDYQQGQFIYKTSASSSEHALGFEQIRGIMATPAMGSRDGKKMLLTLQTEQGKVVLLNEALGTTAQKVDLAQEIETAMKGFSAQ